MPGKEALAIELARSCEGQGFGFEGLKLLMKFRMPCRLFRDAAFDKSCGPQEVWRKRE